jgi:hypothetical protein
MAGKITTNSVVLGDSLTDTQNFVLKTNADGTATLARGALGALGTVFGVNGSGAITGATLVTPALGTPASGVLTNCTGMPAAALPAGSVLQVVNATRAVLASSSSSTFVTTGLTATITPTSASSKILVFANVVGVGKANTNTGCQLRLYRGASSIIGFDDLAGWDSTTTNSFIGACATTYLDSPATTSATTYTVYFASASNSATAFVMNYNANQANSTSTITLMEIAG